MPCLVVYFSNFENLLPYLKTAASNLLNSKVWRKNKFRLNWDQNCLISGIFGLEFRKIMVILESTVLNLSIFKVLCKKKNL